MLASFIYCLVPAGVAMPILKWSVQEVGVVWGVAFTLYVNYYKNITLYIIISLL